MHAALTEQRLVGATGGRLAGEQDQAGGVPVDAVQRHQAGYAQAPGEARLQGLLDVFASGHHRQEVRLVDHHQALVLVEHVLLERDLALLCHLA